MFKVYKITKKGKTARIIINENIIFTHELNNLCTKEEIEDIFKRIKNL